jgi:hypothetical protein
MGEKTEEVTQQQNGQTNFDSALEKQMGLQERESNPWSFCVLI